LIRMEGVRRTMELVDIPSSCSTLVATTGSADCSNQSRPNSVTWHPSITHTHTHKMSWFGGGSQKEEREKSFASTDTDGFDAGDNMLSLGGSDNGGGASEFQQFSMGLQQQLIIQQVITDLSDKAFLKCVSSTRDGQLSGKEVSCIYAATNKWLDTNDFMGGRLAKKSQQQQQGQYQ
jgi:hypothetical protein